MIRLRFAALVSTVALAMFLIGCGGSNGPTFNPTPVIQSLSPDSITAGGPSFTIFLTGVGFLSTSQVFWNGGCVQASPPAATCATVNFNLSSTQLSVTIPAAYITSSGIAQITVVNPAPGGGASIAAATFTINQANNPSPTITSILPSSTAVGVLPPGGTITVNGTRFISNSTVSFNGNPRATQFVSATQLTATMLASDVAGNATIRVTVSNPAPGGGVSNPPAAFTVGLGSAAIVHTLFKSAAQNGPELISVGALGSAADGRSANPAMSADGRFVSFYSKATNLISSGAFGNLFVRDTCVGAMDCTPQTTSVDVSALGTAPDGSASDQAAISADGRFVAFVSQASNLVKGLTTKGGANVYVRDLCAGVNAPAACSPHTDIVSVDSAGRPLGGSFAAISGAGRFVVFLAADAKLYVRDTCSGPTADASCTQKLVQIGADNNPTLNISSPIGLSSEGRYVVFERASRAPNIDPTASEIVIEDTCLGTVASAGCISEERVASLASDGTLLAGKNSLPSVSGDGRFVVFQSSTTAQAGMGVSSTQIYLRDTCLGSSAPAGCTVSTAMIGADAFAPSISSTGRYISYISRQGSSAPGSGTLYVYDTCYGAIGSCVAGAYPVVDSTTGLDALSVTSGNLARAPLSLDGLLVAFGSSAAIDFLPSSGLGDVYIARTSH